VVSGAPGDVLGLGDEDWSNRVGDAAAEAVFRLAVAGFWRLATGWVPGDSIAFLSAGSVSLRSPAGVGPYLELLASADAKTVKNRIHLDVAPEQGEDPVAAVAALRAAGAVPADVGQGAASWTVLADPEGSEFCVLSPR